MAGRARRAALVAAIAAASLPACPALAAVAPRTISRYGVYSFAALGYPTRRLAGEQARRPALVAAYELPPGARERARHWYLVHLHLRIRVAPGSAGRAYVVAVSSGGGASAQIRLDVRDGSAVTWSALGFLDGVQRGTSRTGEVELRFRNVLPYSTVRAGSNRLGIVVQEFGARVDSVDVLGDSAIEYTPRGPAELALHARAEGAAHVGRPLAIELTIANRGDRPAREVAIETESPGAAVRVRGPRLRRVPDVGPRQERRLRIVVVPRETGTERLFFLGSSTANRPGARLDLRVAGPAAAAAPVPQGGSGGRGGAFHPTALELVAVAVLAAAAAVALWPRRRRSGAARAAAAGPSRAPRGRRL